MMDMQQTLQRDRKKIERATMALYIIAGANRSGYNSDTEMIEHFQKIARNAYEDITKKEGE